MPRRRRSGDGALYQITRKTRDGRPYTLWRGVVDLGLTREGKRDQRYVHARTQRDCRKKLEELQAEIAEGGAPLDRRTTVQQWSQEWLRKIVKPDVDPNTYDTYASLVRVWIVPTIGQKSVHSLRPSDIRAVREAQMAAGRSTSTARQTHTVLSLMLEAARAERLCRTNVADDVRRPTSKGAVVTKRDAMPTDQALAVLRVAAAMPDAAGSRWWFKFLAGARQGEILGARVADLDLDAGLYTVNWKLEELMRDHGCGGTCGKKQGAACPQAVWRVPDDFTMEHLTGRWWFTEPKSRTGRVVPLIPALVEAIRRHLKATEEQPNPHGLIWHNPDGSPITPEQDNVEWRALLKAAGVESDATGHWARHTTVTILASLGVDFQIIGEIVGHSSSKVTQMYRHAQAAEKRAAMVALAGVWADALQLPAGTDQG